jgi:hypothetical protein
MNQKIKIFAIVAILALYFIGYVVCRERGELIRRMTYSDGNRAIHKIAPGSYENRIQFLFVASPEDIRYVRRIQIRRSIFKIVYLPLSLAECLVWTIIQAKYK